MRINLNDGWFFSLGEAHDFRAVRVPHDWMIQDPTAWYQSAVGWYRRSLDTGYLQKGQRAYLCFDGVYMNSTLFVNGHKAGEWKNGFTAFAHDITEFLSPEGENELLLKVDARFPSARWYTGAGIYRPVHLEVKNACHFALDGIHVTTRRGEEGFLYEATAEVVGDEGQPHFVRHELLEQGDIIPWSPQEPRLYTLRSTLFCQGQAMDTVDTRFGFRELRFDPEAGFLINGQRMKLNGVCLHQEFSVLGAAVHPDLIRRQFLALQRMGVNAVRTAHNPPSTLFMDLCDEMGMLVCSEFTDVWQIHKTDHDYARYFDAWHERDVASWIRRDRNRPSVIMWSLGNEIPDTHADAERGGEVLAGLLQLVRQHDPQGQALPTLCSNYMAWDNTQRAAAPLDLVGYNYAEFLYQAHHQRYPDWVLFGSETCSTLQSRGIYHFPLSQPVMMDDDFQVSSLGNSTTSWGARSVEDCIKSDRDTPFSLGHFVWAGQDYLGEPTPYQSKNSYFGMLDTAGFEKDAFHLFRSAWTDSQAAPMVHLFPYWDFSRGQVIDVLVCSNQHTVALFLNGEAIGRAEMGGEITRAWRVPFRPGVLRAQAYDALGRLTAAAEQATSLEAERLVLKPEHFSELSFVSISAEDSQGRPVPNANRRVKVQVDGGELLGLDNGDATDDTPYQADSRRLFSGKLLAVCRRHAGQELRVEARLCGEDIPVRRIELAREGLRVTARTLPEEAGSQALAWRLTNAAGVDSPLATFVEEEGGRSIRIVPHGDGNLQVRCGVTNGKPGLDLYSLLECELAGYGQVLLNPYQELSAALYTKSNVRLGSGVARGVATPREGETRICFDMLDFGARGANELSAWLFPQTDEPFQFEVYDGLDVGAKLLARARYDLGMVWNTYQELRFPLLQPVQGLASLCFVFHQKTHFRGFMAHGVT